MAKKKARHRTQAKPAPSTTALAKRTPQRVEIAITDPRPRAEVVPASNETALVLGDEAVLGALGLVEVKLTEKEEMVLSEAVLKAEVLIKPTGQPYLSHPSYTRWFNRAFGRLGWAIVARSKPIRQGNSVVCPYVLFIHGQPAAFAYGEQEYFDNNREQTFGDAVEATVASALRRCAKRLGVGLELWDRTWLNQFIDEACVKVWLKDHDKPAWRRRSDPPFWNEVQAGESRAPQRQAGTPPPRAEAAPTHNDGNGASVISDPQRKRLWVIMKKAGRDERDVKAWLKARYGWTSSKQITRDRYNAICTAIESPAPLEMPLREPGGDD